MHLVHYITFKNKWKSHVFLAISSNPHRSGTHAALKAAHFPHTFPLFHIQISHFSPTSTEPMALIKPEFSGDSKHRKKQTKIGNANFHNFVEVQIVKLTAAFQNFSETIARILEKLQFYGELWTSLTVAINALQIENVRAHLQDVPKKTYIFYKNCKSIFIVL